MMMVVAVVWWGGGRKGRRVRVNGNGMRKEVTVTMVMLLLAVIIEGSLNEGDVNKNSDINAGAHNNIFFSCTSSLRVRTNAVIQYCKHKLPFTLLLTVCLDTSFRF